MSPCGHFAIVGYDNGTIAKFNIQSGILRARYQGPNDAGSLKHPWPRRFSRGPNKCCFAFYAALLPPPP